MENCFYCSNSTTCLICANDTFLKFDGTACVANCDKDIGKIIYNFIYFKSNLIIYIYK